ncbi:MAG: hypothetical protein K0R17_2725 [Rariglobus sp.]|nr:hypothetical protein [Rariglobus sp.]
MTSPSSPLPIGIVGLNFGRCVLEYLQREPAARFFKLAAVCDLDAAKVAEFSSRYGVTGHTSLEALLADPDIPVVGLFTGPAGRAGLLRQIIRAGKDVMTTKPFEVKPDAARAVLDEARFLGRVIHLNAPAPALTPAFEKIREWVSVHDLGRPVFARGEITAAYREQADGSWYDDPVRCPVAPIFRLGIYLIQDLVRLFGPVASVQVQHTRLFTRRPTPDNAQLGLTFANGALGSIFASFCVDNGQHYANALLLHYERGTIQLNLDPAPYGKASATSRLRLISQRDQQVVTEDWSCPGSSGAYQWEELHRAIHVRDVASMPIDEIMQGIAIIQAMTRAEKSSATESVST